MITINYRKEVYIFQKTLSVKQVFENLDLSPESHLMIRAGEMLTEKDRLKDGDVVKVIPVISGG